MSRTPPQAPLSRQSGQARPTTSEVAESKVPGRTVSGVYSQGRGVSTSQNSIRKRKSLDDGNVTEIELSSGPSPSTHFTPEAKKRISFQLPPKTPREKRITVVLPNSTRISIRRQFEAKAPSLNSFLQHLQNEVETEADLTISNRRMVQWGKNVWLRDVRGKKIADDEMLRETLQSQLVTIILEDGHSASKHCVEWNITPEPQMLGRLPQGYNMETALADEVDNALQAVWSVVNQKRLVSVDIQPEKISIFDTGLGMDGHNICNWGTVGSSTHRDVHRQAVGGSPPYLKPYLGKYGAGGVAAALHLGSMVTVSSKTRESSKVVTLVMDKEELERRRRSNDPDLSKEWQTGGEYRDMTAEEKEKAPDGSFTLVEITQLKRQYSVPKEISKVRRILTDIYFLYIHSEEFGVSNRRLKYPIEFEVNEENLAEVQECETAISNQHTCHGDPFIITLGFTGVLQDPNAGGRSRSQNKDTAHAEIKCYYYPNLKGKEELDTVLEKLAKLGLTTQSFEDIPRVMVRWLGRLLPENKWGLLPFMRVPAKRLAQGWKKHWEKRVRATVAVDAGFHPTQSKTQLERDQPFTVALEKLGDPEDAKNSSAADVELTIKVEGKALNTSQLADEYMQWLRTMHETFDEEVEFLDESPTYIVDQPPFEVLGLNKDHTQLAIVFYKHMRDGTGEWNASESARPLRVKLQRGATGVNKDLYATIEWFYCQGTGDEHGEVRMVCRPIDVLVEDGSKIKTTKRGRVTFALNKSQWFSVALLNTPKCQRLSNDEWVKKEAEIAKKAPSFIEVLNEDDSKALQCEKTLPHEMRAGSKLPHFLAVIRPKQGTGASFKQGMIYGKALEMQLRVTFTEKFATVPKERSREPTPSKSGAELQPSGQLIWEGTVKGDHTKSGIKGLYLFDTNKMGLAENLVKQGIYYFNFELVSPSDKSVKPLERKVRVQASMQTKCWTVCTHKGKCDDTHPNTSICINTRLMEQSTEELHLSKLDGFSNPQLILKLPTLRVTAVALDGSSILTGTVFNPTDMAISSDKHYLTLRKKVMFNEGDLRIIAPTHEARLAFEIKDGKATDNLSSVNNHVAELKCRVFPGWIASVLVETSPALDSKVPFSLKEPVRPTDFIEVLTFQGKDSFGNIVEKGQKVEILLEGLRFEDKNGAIREVDEQGLLKLGGLLKVTGPHNSIGSVTIRTLERKGKKKETLLELFLKVASCSLRIASLVENTYLVGSSLEGVIVEVLDYNGVVDTTIDGPYHTLTLNWMKNITVPIEKGKSELPKFLLPATAGPWLGKIVHTTYKNLKLDLQLNLELGIACRLDLPTQNQILSARCDDVISLKFLALDGSGMPAQLTAKMCANILLEIEHDAYASGECTVNCLEIIESNPSLTSYEARVHLGGTVGEYKVVAVDPSRTLQQQPGSTAILSWRVRLDQGRLERLAPVVMTGELSQTSCNLVSLLATCQKSITVAECSMFPPVYVYLLDAYENLCDYYDTQVLDLVLVTKGGGKHSGLIRTTYSSCQIDKSRGVFEPFKLEAGVGSYKIVISTSNMSFMPGTHGPEEPEFILEVTPGNHPSALHFLEESPIVFRLTPETEVLPTVAIIVDCADNRPLQSLISPLMVIHPETPDSPCIMTCKGELSDSEEISAEFRPSSLFMFSRIYVPSQAGTYTLKVSLPEDDIPTVSRQLVVRHGLPAQVELCVAQSGQKRPVLLAKLLDAHGNVCIEKSGLILTLELSVAEDQEEPLSTQGIERSCLLLSEDFAVVESGIATFEEIRLSPGRLGAYTLTAAVEEDQKQLESWPPLKPAELQMLVTSSLTQKFQENIKAARDAIKEQKDKLNSLKREMSTGKEDIQHHQGELNDLLRKRSSLPIYCVNANDDEILAQATMQPKRTNEEVMLDIRKLAEKGLHGSSLAFLEACARDNFLSPHAEGPLAGEGIGLPVTLARVESPALNKILSEYMGTATLLLIVCKTQQGINSLEVKINGILDTRFGLASVSRHPLKGFFEVLALSDSRPWTGSIDESHPQRLLNIPPPWMMVNGERRKPPGFVAYAVNLLHIKDEHLRMRFAIKSHPNYSFGLRESLFYFELQNLQVYDTQENMLHAKERNSISFAAISLDGHIFRARRMRLRLGEAAVRLPVSFALVSVEERLATCGLLQPAAGAIERKKRARSLSSTLEALEQQIRELTEACVQRAKESERICEEVTVLEKSLQEAQSQEKKNLEVLAHQQRQADASTRRPDQLCFSFL